MYGRRERRESKRKETGLTRNILLSIEWPRVKINHKEMLFESPILDLLKKLVIYMYGNTREKRKESEWKGTKWIWNILLTDYIAEVGKIC